MHPPTFCSLLRALIIQHLHDRRSSLLSPENCFAAEELLPTAGILLHLILPHSLRCPADVYLTQVAMQYPHLHRQDGQSVVYGHYEEPTTQVKAFRMPKDMQTNCQDTALFTGHLLSRLKTTWTMPLDTPHSRSPPSSPFILPAPSVLTMKVPSSSSSLPTMTPSLISKMP